MTQLEKPRTERFASTRVKSAKRLWGSQVWFQLLLVRPWLLVVGFWLVSVVVGVSALEGIVKPKPLIAGRLIAGRIEAGEAVGRAAPAEPSAAPSFVMPSTRPALTDPDAASDLLPVPALRTGFPIWSLSAVVGTCAVGCVMLSRWQQPERTPPRTRRSRSARPAAAPRPARSGQAHQKSQAQTNREQQPVISVVPASESHTLDWPEGSLAHQLDVRAKRSLSSFL